MDCFYLNCLLIILNIVVFGTASPMKPLFWKRIQLNQVSDCNPEIKASETVWATLEEPVINVDHFAEMFAKVGRKTEGKLLSSRCMHRIKQEVVHLLDNKRSQTVGIFLSSLHVHMDEIEDALYNVNTSILDQESLQSLYEIVSMLMKIMYNLLCLMKHTCNSTKMDKLKHFWSEFAYGKC